VACTFILLTVKYVEGWTVGTGQTHWESLQSFQGFNWIMEDPREGYWDKKVKGGVVEEGKD